MGCGAFNTAIWVSPWDVTEDVAEVSRRLGIEEHVQVFRSQHVGFASAKELASWCWDLKRINSQYAAFVEKYDPMLSRDGPQSVQIAHDEHDLAGDQLPVDHGAALRSAPAT